LSSIRRSSQISRSPFSVGRVLEANRPERQRFGYRLERGLSDRNADYDRQPLTALKTIA
jgi:hypothetical protein